MAAWGHGYCLPREDYLALRWERVLEEITSSKRPDPQVSDGAKISARAIEGVILNPESDPAGA